MSEVALVAMLDARAQLVALVGDRIAPGFLPQSETERPALTYQMITDVPEPAMNVDTGVSRARYQVNIWAANAPSAMAVRVQVKAALKRIRGTFAGVVVQDTFFSVGGAAYDDAASDASGSEGEHHIPCDVVMNYLEA